MLVEFHGDHDINATWGWIWPPSVLWISPDLRQHCLSVNNAMTFVRRKGGFAGGNIFFWKHRLVYRQYEFRDVRCSRGFNLCDRC